MRIPCPICGLRDSREFRILGEAGAARPDGDIAAADPAAQMAAQMAAFADYVYRRDNLPGPMREYWFHASGCRGWLIVRRDARTHEVLGAELAAEVRK